MSDRYKKVKTIHLKEGEVIAVQGLNLTIMRPKTCAERPLYEEVDITEECTVELVKSTCSNGFYCAISHKNHRRIFALGVDEKSKIISMTGSHFIKKVEGSTVSFRVFKEVYNG